MSRLIGAEDRQPRAGRNGVIDVVVIGAGQAGLALAHRLQQAGTDFLVVDSAGRVGDSWRLRWDSLRLFTPLPFARLPGCGYPAGTGRLPDKDAVADYLADYARHFDFPLLLSSRVRRLTRDGGLFRIDLADGRVLRAVAVAVATGPYAAPAVPTYAGALDARVKQLHSSQYKAPSDLPSGDVLIVGAANTGAQLAVELHRAGRRVTLAASKPPWFLPTRLLGVGLYRWLRASGLLAARSGGRVEGYVQRRGDAIVGTELRPLLREGQIALRPRVVGAAGDRLTFADGSVLGVTAVLWATGYRPALEWVDVPGTMSTDGYPVHQGGISPEPGLVWIGLPWQTRMDSGIICGVDGDARRLLPALLRYCSTASYSAERARHVGQPQRRHADAEPTPAG